MEEQLATLQRQLAESEAQIAKEQDLREEEQRLREEEKRLREIAEADAAQSQPKNLVDYLKSCHGFSIALEVVTDKTLTTQGDTTKPAGRLFPRRIVPWNDFPLQQETIWEKLSISPPFTTKRVYPSAHQLEYVQRYLDPISSELGLRHYARETVENPVRTLIEEMHKFEPLREQLRLGGTLMFESHTNLGNTSQALIEEEVQYMSISEPNSSKTEGRRTKGKGKGGRERGKGGGARGRNRGVTGTADQFCIYELADGQRVPVVLVEYKAPHKLPLSEIITGLRGEIRPAEEVINREGDDIAFISKSLVAAVITQLFSSMIGKGVQRGYIFTGEAIIFLYIPDDPTTVKYHLSIPRLDFRDEDENRFHRTAVAQITAFALNALATEAPGQSWHDATANLDTWAVEYIDILKRIPETIRKAPRHSAYKSGSWKGFSRSPIQTRARRLAAGCNKKADEQACDSGGDNDDNEGPPTPTPSRASRPGVNKGRSAPARQPRVTRGPNKSDASEQDVVEGISRPRIEDRPYCTQQCLLGLVSGGALDNHCPNLGDHRGEHLQLTTFLCLIRAQLAKDRGREADCKPLYVKGARGALVKLRLSSHGYTLVAKAMMQRDHKYLRKEANVYTKLCSLQGDRIPVCLGTIDLELPYYYDYGIYTSMLFLSWAGRPLHEYLNQKNAERVLNEVSETLTALHKYHVLHMDAELRNWLWDEQRGCVMLVDFERAEIRTRHPLGVLSPNRKRNQQGKMKFMAEDADFDREIQKAQVWISQYIR